MERPAGFDGPGDRVNKTLPKYSNIVVARQSGYYRREKTLPVVEDLLQRHSDGAVLI
jgi:ABC-type sugar transport system substrate-binding protein